MRIRLARPEELPAVGEVTVAAYAGFTRGPGDPYVARLRDAAARAEEAELWVAVPEDASDRPGPAEVLGSVTTCPPGSPWREVARDGEGEFRMLAVAPAAQGQGVGAELVRHVLALEAARGRTRVVLSSLAEMAAAHRLYGRLGFRRLPERDWDPVPGVHLLAFVHDLGADT